MILLRVAGESSYTMAEHELITGSLRRGPADPNGPNSELSLKASFLSLADAEDPAARASAVRFTGKVAEVGRSAWPTELKT